VGIASSESVLLLRLAALFQQFIVMGQLQRHLFIVRRKEELSCPCVVLYISSKLCWEVYPSVFVTLRYGFGYLKHREWYSGITNEIRNFT